MTVPTLPPGPTNPMEEQVERFNRDSFGYLEELAQRYGTLFTLRLGALGNEGLVDGIEANGAWVFLTRPHQLRIMYGTPDTVASGAQANALFFGTNEKSVAYLDGEAHRCRRSQVQPPFTGGSDYSAIMVDVIRRCLRRWPRERPVRMFDELQQFTAEVIVEVVCGNFAAADREQLRAMLPRTENARYSREELVLADKEIRAFVHERIEGHLDRCDAAGHDDVLGRLLRHAADDTTLSTEVLRDEVFSLLYTGFSTTANTLSWAFVRILGDPDVHRKVLAEVGDRFADGPLTRESFAGLPYLESLILETLRLHPVTPLNGVRLLREPLRVDDHLIPAGTILVHCAYLSQRSPDVVDQPLRFCPERFDGGPPDPYVFGAFGGGRRTCLGRSYSKEEMKIVLATVFSTLRLELVGGFPGSRQQGFFMAPDNGAPVLIRS